MNEKMETKTRKKTEHTRMYAQLCSSANTIFTSVVVYSRTTEIKNNNITRVVCKCALFILLLDEIVIIRRKREKKRSTHEQLHNCAARRTQYSRRLLSILAQQKLSNKKSKTCGENYINWICQIVNYDYQRKKRKKTEHTRMYAQLCSSVSAIFTSVVVYSRTKKT